jgi:hypothetical protein
LETPGGERNGSHQATKARSGHEDSLSILPLCSSHLPRLVPLWPLCASLCLFVSTGLGGAGPVHSLPRASLGWIHAGCSRLRERKRPLGTISESLHGLAAEHVAKRFNMTIMLCSTPVRMSAIGHAKRRLPDAAASGHSLALAPHEIHGISSRWPTYSALGLDSPFRLAIVRQLTA